MTVEIGRRRHRLRDTFIVTQVTVSLMLLIAAGLFLRSLGKALSVDPGFDVAHTAAVKFDLVLQGYGPERRALFKRQLLDRVRALPGVQAAGYTDPLPLSGRNYGSDATADGGSEETGKGFARVVSQSGVSSGFFEAMGIGVLRGRAFGPRDDASAPKVAIVNQTLARQLWPGEDPIGKRFRSGGDGEILREVVGLVPDGKYGSLTEEPRAFAYFPDTQRREDEVNLVARSSGDPANLVKALTAAVLELDPDLPLSSAATLSQIIANGVSARRGAAALLGVFGSLALILSGLGIAGVTAHTVTLKTREIGIRMSLGGRAADVVALFVRQSVMLTALGAVIGLVLSAVLSGVLAKFLFGLAPRDAATFAVGATVLCVVAIVASWVPARRAARVDPMVALRAE